MPIALPHPRSGSRHLSDLAQERAFHRFYRSDLSHSKETAGHGLGLSIAREIARAHGGNVTLLHSDSHWTEFSIVLPVMGRCAQAVKPQREARQDRQLD